MYLFLRYKVFKSRKLFQCNRFFLNNDYFQIILQIHDYNELLQLELQFLLLDLIIFHMNSWQK